MTTKTTQFFWLGAERKFARKSQWVQVFSPGKLILCSPDTPISLNTEEEAHGWLREYKKQRPRLLCRDKTGTTPMPSNRKATIRDEHDRERYDKSKERMYWRLFLMSFIFQRLGASSLIQRRQVYYTPVKRAPHSCNCTPAHVPHVHAWSACVCACRCTECPSLVCPGSFGRTRRDCPPRQRMRSDLAPQPQATIQSPHSLESPTRALRASRNSIADTCPSSWAPFGIQDCFERTTNFEKTSRWADDPAVSTRDITSGCIMWWATSRPLDHSGTTLPRCGDWPSVTYQGLLNPPTRDLRRENSVNFLSKTPSHIPSVPSTPIG